ncbi:MAG: N-terminal domain of molybdenum-binding protein [Halorubrum sp. J07HR59]|nr:MAG: N-terminal domain of molybdenum-binding protein [Halorubrum sp. J07HR59]
MRDGVELDDRDVALLREIDTTGTIAAASANLGRSRARDTSRIDDLEAAFGELVDRHRGGSDGGGSRLTDTGSRVLNRYERLQVALSATAQVPETTLEGAVTQVTGEVAEVDTCVGRVRGLHRGIDAETPVQVRIGADAITVLVPSESLDPNVRSTRNNFTGTVTEITRGQTVWTVRINVDGTAFQALVTETSADRMELSTGDRVAIAWKATATRLAQGL